MTPRVKHAHARANCLAAAAALTAALALPLAGCDTAGDLMAGQGHVHRIVRSLCVVHQSGIYADQMTGPQITAATALCRSYGWAFGRP